MFPPGIEPGTFRVLGGCDNHYTTETLRKTAKTTEVVVLRPPSTKIKLEEFSAKNRMIGLIFFFLVPVVTGRVTAVSDTQVGEQLLQGNGHLTFEDGVHSVV